MTPARQGAARFGAAAKALLKVLISAGLIALVIYKTGSKGIFERLLDVNIPAMLAGAVIMAALVTLPALRWKLLIRLSGAEFGLPWLYKLLMIGNFLAQAIPSIGADGVRAWYLHRNGLSLASAVNSTLLDRLIAFAALLLLSIVSLPWLSRLVPPLLTWWMIGLALVAAVVALVMLWGFDWLPAGWTARWRIVWLAQNMTAACRALARAPRVLLAVVGLSVAVHLLLAVFVYGLAGFVHVPVGLAECLLLFPLVILVATIPVGIAGWGMREGAMVVAFGFLGMPAADALLISILFGLVVAVSTIPGFVFWLMLGRKEKMLATSNER